VSGYKYTIGVDFGGTYVKLALLRFAEGSYRIEGYSLFLTQNYNRDELIEQLVIRIIKLKAESIYKGHKIKGVGIGVPGRVDFRQGIVCDLTNVSGWRNVNLRVQLETKIKVPVFIDNDANLMALAESRFGVAKGVDNCVCVTLGTGIGGGLILNGKIYRGTNFAAGEIGHITLNENGPVCACGSKGCAECYVGNHYILEQAIQKMRKGAQTSLKTMIDKRYSNLTLEMISKAARQKDAFSMILWHEVGRHIGVLIAGIVNILNPEVVVLGGGVAKAGKLILDPIRMTVKQRAFKVSRTNLIIVVSKFKEKAGIIGAATLALESNRKL